jgi:hypothetical protein
VSRQSSIDAPGATPPPTAIAVARIPSRASGSQRGAADIIADLVPLPLTPSADPISATVRDLLVVRFRKNGCSGLIGPKGRFFT